MLVGFNAKIDQRMMKKVGATNLEKLNGKIMLHIHEFYDWTLNPGKNLLFYSLSTSFSQELPCTETERLPELPNQNSCPSHPLFQLKT